MTCKVNLVVLKHWAKIFFYSLQVSEKCLPKQKKSYFTHVVHIYIYILGLPDYDKNHNHGYLGRY